MAQLLFKQTTAPDFSSVSATLERAGLSMERGFESAEGLLGSYQAGQQEKVDNEVFSEIAGMNREQLQDYFTTNKLKGRAISKDMRDRLGKQFGVIAGNVQTRQVTSNMAAGQLIRNAAESRTAVNEVDRLAARDYARSNAVGAAQANLEAKKFGQTGDGSVVPGATAPGVPGPRTVDGRISAAAPGLPGPTAAPAPGAPGPTTPAVSATKSSFMTQVGAGYTKSDGTAVPGVKNPYALAVIAATGQHESGFDPTNVNREWADGENNAGGTMSWNGKRLKAMKKFVGDDKSPEAQARFLLSEDPDLMKRLEASTSIEEANDIMAKAWRFKGYKDTGEGSEYAGRLATAKSLYSGGDAQAQAAAPQIDPATSLPVDPLSPLRAVGGSVGDTIGRGTPGINRISGTGPAGATGEVIPTGPGAQGRGELSLGQVPLTAIPRGPGTPAADVLGVGEGGAVVPSAAQTIEKAAVPEVRELIEDPRKFRDARIAQIMANPYLTGDQMNAKIDALAAATTAGEAEILRVKAVARMENLVAAATKWADDPKSDMKLETLQKILSDMPGTAVEKAAAGLFALEIGNGALKYKISPSYIADPSVKRGVADELARNRKTLEIQTVHRIMNNAKLFGDDDPTAGLEELVKSANDGQAQTPYFWGFAGQDATAENSLRKLVIFIADEAGVTPAIAAAAMADRFTPDPAGFNTNEHRFDKRGTIDWLKANANETALRTYEGDVERVARREDELNAGGVRLSVMRSQYKKMNDSNSTPQQRKEAKRAFTALQNTLKAGRTPVEAERALQKYIGHDEGGLGIAKHLRSLEPGSPEWLEATEFVRMSIESDGTISAAHKRLLLAAINS